MNEFVHRIKLLSTVALLLASLLQPLTVAAGLTCSRTHPAHDAAEASQLVSSSAVEYSEARLISTHHHHDTIPATEAATTAAGTCTVAALAREPHVHTPTYAAMESAGSAHLPPARFLTESLFRPPRLS